jgi:hypothetical protein
MFLAIPAPRFFPRELHSVIGDKRGGEVRMTPQLRRYMHWWTKVPVMSNGKQIKRPIETSYIYTDRSYNGWGAVLNCHKKAIGFGSECDEAQHIMWNELKPFKLGVHAFLPQLRKSVLLHEDNHAACYILGRLTSRLPRMMTELRKL